MSNENINSKDFIIGSLIGAFLGATTALLLAPKSGKELRGDIGQQANVVKEKTANISSVVSEQSSQLMNKVKDLRPSVKEEVDPLNEVKDIESAIDELSRETNQSTTDEIDKSKDEVKMDVVESQPVLQNQK
jgi:gas vesicle protein